MNQLFPCAKVYRETTVQTNVLLRLNAKLRSVAKHCTDTHLVYTVATMAQAEPPKKIRGVYEHPKGSGVWWIQYFDHGRRRRERVGTKSNAGKLYQKRRTQILTGDKLPELQRKRVTMGELIDDAIVYAREHNRSIRTYVGMGALLRPAFGVRSAEDIKPDDLAAWIRRREVGPATFNRYRSFLSLCFREGMRHGKVPSNPARLLAQKREPRGRKRYLSREEYELVLAKIQEVYPDRVSGFVISVHTGMRLGEQFGLRWKNIDLGRREIHLAGTKNGDDRTIPMSSLVFDHFTRLRPKNAAPNALVFARPLGGKGATQPRWFTTLLRAEDLAIEEYTWHNNRHTFCSWLAMAGTPLRTIQELAGHKTITMSARYSHLSPDHKTAEIEKLVNAGRPKLVNFPRATQTAIG